MQNMDDNSLSDASFACDNAATCVAVSNKNAKGNGEQKSDSFGSYNLYSGFDNFIDYADQNPTNKLTRPVRNKCNLARSSNDSVCQELSVKSEAVTENNISGLGFIVSPLLSLKCI